MFTIFNTVDFIHRLLAVKGPCNQFDKGDIGW